MKLSALKALLPNVGVISFKLPDGSLVAPHYHLSELGNFSKTFMDCGGKIRISHSVNMQLWTADDTDHRFTAEKLGDIIQLAEEKINLLDGEIEIEYQGKNTIEKYGLDYDGEYFVLKPTLTACLADGQSCIVVPNQEEKPKINLSNLAAKTSGCTPGSGCC